MSIDRPEKIAPNSDIQRALEWFLSFLPAEEWKRRKAAIEAHLEDTFRPVSNIVGIDSLRRVVGTDDQIAWYLYLVETSLHEPYRIETEQAARILPVFERLGADLDRLTGIRGVDTQITKVLGASKRQPDSVLFEILVALLWSKNGWHEVSFIPADFNEKKPDIRAAGGGVEWFIETKRLATNSGYSSKEREKWLRIWARFKDSLLKVGYPLIFEITFHVELESLSDDFLNCELASKLRLVIGSCQLIDNEIWSVRVKLLDFTRITDHLKDNYVKYPSRQLQELVGGKWERGKGFTSLISASLVRVGEGGGCNQFVDEIEWAAGAYWHCDAPRAIEAKARDIRGHLAEAVKQLPSGSRGVIHIGIETPDGEHVEAERYARIVETVRNFEAKGKDLAWVYVHLFESYSPPQGALWLLDETVYNFGSISTTNAEPLAEHFAISPHEGEKIPSMHWLRDPP